MIPASIEYDMYQGRKLESSFFLAPVTFLWLEYIAFTAFARWEFSRGWGYQVSGPKGF